MSVTQFELQQMIATCVSRTQYNHDFGQIIHVLENSSINTNTGNFSLTGISYFENLQAVNETISGNLCVDGEAFILNLLAGTGSFYGNLSADGNIKGHNITATGTLSIAGGSFLHNTTLNGNLSVGGSAAIGSDILVNGAIDSNISDAPSVAYTTAGGFAGLEANQPFQGPAFKRTNVYFSSSGVATFYVPFPVAYTPSRVYVSSNPANVIINNLTVNSIVFTASSPSNSMLSIEGK